MGISIGCAIVVGLQGEDLYDLLSEERQQQIDDGGWYEVLGEEDGGLGLDAFPPAFDCDPQYNYWGIEVYKSYGDGKEISEGEFDQFRERVIAAREKFKSITGLDGKLYITPNVW